MTAPTLTISNGFLDDCISTTGWTETESGLTSALTVVNDEIFKIEGTCDNVADEYAYYEKDITNLDSDVYTKFKIRYKTSATSAGLAAKVILIFTSGTQTILAESYTGDVWTVASGDITASKTIDKIQLYADDNPDTIAAGTFQVYYDFILLHKNTFTFPYVSRDGKSGGVSLNITRDRVKLNIPSRDGRIIQGLGVGDIIIRLTGDMDTNTEWGTSPIGLNLYKLMKDDDLWSWFTSDLINCKVYPVSFHVEQAAGSSKNRLWELVLEQYSYSSGKESIWDGLSWWGL